MKKIGNCSHLKCPLRKKGVKVLNLFLAKKSLPNQSLTGIINLKEKGLIHFHHSLAVNNLSVNNKCIRVCATA